MKNKFQRLSKEEQLEAKKQYIERNPYVYKRFKKLSLTCTIGIIYAILVLIFDLLFRNTLLNGSFTLNIIIDGFVLIFCTAFYVFSKDTINRQINKMLVEDLRKQQIDKWNKEKEQLKNEVNVDYEKSAKKKSTKKTTKKTTTKKTTTKKSTKTKSKNKE
jgi:amino acid permease